MIETILSEDELYNKSTLESNLTFAKKNTILSLYINISCSNSTTKLPSNGNLIWMINKSTLRQQKALPFLPDQSIYNYREYSVFSFARIHLQSSGEIKWLLI